MNQIVTISAPLYIQLGKTRNCKKYYLNFNTYRTYHHTCQTNLKRRYKEILAPQLLGLSFGKIKLTFTLYRKDKRKGDRSNVLSIHEKFAADALVELGCLVDDNDEFIESSHYFTGPIDRENGRVEIAIKRVN